MASLKMLNNCSFILCPGTFYIVFLSVLKKKKQNNFYAAQLSKLTN